MPDPFDLARFVAAQQPVYQDVCAELRRGRKSSHWMWFIFPQLKSLGRSGTARHFGIEGAEEARAYLAHELLGPRLRECAQRVLDVRGSTAQEIFGSPDDLKLRSCMTLFEQVAPGEPVFGEVLDRYYAGERDALTLSALSGAASA